jgi:hypothetical protein
MIGVGPDEIKIVSINLPKVTAPQGINILNAKPKITIIETMKG